MVDVTISASAGGLAQLIRTAHRILRKPLPDLSARVHTVRGGRGLVVVTNKGDGPAFNIRATLFAPRHDVSKPVFHEKYRRRDGSVPLATHLEPDETVQHPTEPWSSWSDSGMEIGVRLDWDEYAFWGGRNRRRPAHYERIAPVTKRPSGA